MPSVLSCHQRVSDEIARQLQEGALLVLGQVLSKARP